MLSLTNMQLLAVFLSLMMNVLKEWVTLLLISGEVFGSQSGLNVSYPSSSVCPACSLLKHAITDFWVCRVLVKTKSSVDPCHLDSPQWTDFLLPTSSLVRLFVLILSWTVETPLLIWLGDLDQTDKVKATLSFSSSSLNSYLPDLFDVCVVCWTSAIKRVWSVKSPSDCVVNV